METTRKLIAAGLICDGSGRVLLTRRREDQAHPGMWELPGGKIELGESPPEALARELREEIAVEVEVGRIWEVLYHDYGAFEVVMLVYPCRIIGDTEPRCIEVADLAWSGPEGLDGYDVLPADAPLVSRLRREGAPEFDPAAGKI